MTEVRTGHAVSLQIETVRDWGIFAAVVAGIGLMAVIVFGAARQ